MEGLIYCAMKIKSKLPHGCFLCFVCGYLCWPDCTFIYTAWRSVEAREILGRIIIIPLSFTPGMKAVVLLDACYPGPVNPAARKSLHLERQLNNITGNR